MSVELNIKIYSIDTENCQCDNLTATCKCEAELLGYSIPWNEGYGRHKNHDVRIAYLENIECRITVKDDYNGYEIDWHSPESQYPINEIHFDTSAIKNDIDEFAEQFILDCKDSYQEQ